MTDIKRAAAIRGLTPQDVCPTCGSADKGIFDSTAPNVNKCCWAKGFHDPWHDGGLTPTQPERKYVSNSGILASVSDRVDLREDSTMSYPQGFVPKRTTNFRQHQRRIEQLILEGMHDGKGWRPESFARYNELEDQEPAALAHAEQCGLEHPCATSANPSATGGRPAQQAISEDSVEVPQPAQRPNETAGEWIERVGRSTVERLLREEYARFGVSLRFSAPATPPTPQPELEKLVAAVQEFLKHDGGPGSENYDASKIYQARRAMQSALDSAARGAAKPCPLYDENCTDYRRAGVPVAPANGAWPTLSVQRAFVEGVRFWQFRKFGATAFPSDLDEAEAAAIEKYGPVAGVLVIPTREELAQWFFDSEAEDAEREDEKSGHAATSYARWPEDSAVQPYCRWAYRRADAFLAKVWDSALEGK